MVAQANRLPGITAALVLGMVGQEVFRDAFGMAACCTRGIGAQRRKLGPVAEDPALTLDLTETARDQARQVLAGMCGTCRFQRCKMKFWDIKRPSG